MIRFVIMPARRVIVGLGFRQELRRDAEIWMEPYEPHWALT